METNSRERTTDGPADGATRAIVVIAVAQLLGTSLWFSANGAMRELQAQWQLSASDVGWLTNAVQLGFIIGTLLSALTGLADRFPAHRIFGVCAVGGACLNGLFALASHGIASALVFRFGVGIALAGIYPLGMKLLVTWAPGRAAQTLALLVAMLTLGTSSVHGMRAAFGSLPWQAVVLSSSVFAMIGAALVMHLGEGSHVRRGGGNKLSFGRGVLQIFSVRKFRFSAFGYFGHMWELYAFWTLTPLLVHHALSGIGEQAMTATSLWSFIVIAAGALGCIAGGALAKIWGSAKVAGVSLAASGTICALYPFLTQADPAIQLGALVVWGIFVIADSPQFSALSAAACPPEKVGAALTIQNCIGFFLSGLSIFIATQVYPVWGAHVAWMLLPGPVLGYFATSALFRKGESESL